MLIFVLHGGKSSIDGEPLWVINAFVDGLMKRQAVRIGWVRADVTDGANIPRGLASIRRATNCAPDGVSTLRGVANTSRVNETGKWLRAKAFAQHSELLLPVLYVAAAHFSLWVCVGARVGRAFTSVEGILECKRTSSS